MRFRHSRAAIGVKDSLHKDVFLCESTEPLIRRMLRASTLSHRERLSVKVEDMSSHKRRPLGLEWRASSWTVTFVIGLGSSPLSIIAGSVEIHTIYHILLGIAVDLLVYSVIISVMPFHLEHLGYSKISSRTGWLLFAFVSLASWKIYTHSKH